MKVIGTLPVPRRVIKARSRESGELSPSLRRAFIVGVFGLELRALDELEAMEAERKQERERAREPGAEPGAELGAEPGERLARGENQVEGESLVMGVNNEE